MTTLTYPTPTWYNTLAQRPGRMNDPNLVTVVRRKVVYEEVVITREKFNRLGNLSNDEYCHFLESFQDWGFDHNILEENSFVAFSGDITDGTDDVLYSYDDELTWSKGLPCECVTITSYFRVGE